MPGLGACTSITLRMYTDHKQWPLESTVVHLNHRTLTSETMVETRLKDEGEQV
jgi:uncharacterized OsmC-like protein